LSHGPTTGCPSLQAPPLAHGAAPNAEERQRHSHVMHLTSGVEMACHKAPRREVEQGREGRHTPHIPPHTHVSAARDSSVRHMHKQLHKLASMLVESSEGRGGERDGAVELGAVPSICHGPPTKKTNESQKKKKKHTRKPHPGPSHVVVHEGTHSSFKHNMVFPTIPKQQSLLSLALQRNG
jgi:hypothetical protein